MAEGGLVADCGLAREDRGGSEGDRSAGMVRIGVSPLGVIPDPLPPSLCAGEEGKGARPPHARGRRQTRAGAGGRDDAPSPAVVAIRLAPGARRVPLALADVALGDLTVTFALARLRRGRLDLRPPETPDGAPAVEVPAELRERIVAAVMDAARKVPDVWAVMGPRW